MNFGERLQLIHETKHISQRQLALQIGMAPENVQRYKSTGSTPKTERITDFSVALNISSFLLEESNWGYVPLETKGDLIALIIEGIKRGLIAVEDSDKDDLHLEINTVISQFFKRSAAPVITDPQIVEAVKVWNDEWTIDYLAHKDVNTEEVQQYQLDDLTRKQISFAIMYDEPIK